MSLHQRCLATLRKLERVWDVHGSIQPFQAVHAVECCGRLRDMDLARTWVRRSGIRAVELLELSRGPAQVSTRQTSLGVVEAELTTASGTRALVVGVSHADCNHRVLDCLAAVQPLGALVIERAGDTLHAGEEFAPHDAPLLALAAEEVGGSSPESWRPMEGLLGSSEELAMGHAFARGVPVLSGDRPQSVTWARAIAGQTPVDADELFEATVRQRPVPCPAVLDERDAVLCWTLRDAARRFGNVACVVGAAHVEGISQLWQQGDDALDALASAYTIEPKLPDPWDLPGAAVDSVAAVYGILDAVFAPHVKPSRHLPPLPGPACEVVARVRALYTSPEMRLAVFTAHELAELLQTHEDRTWDEALIEAQIWHESLATVRAARPCNGGPGHTPRP